jgi:hypothetical protein
MFGSQSLEIVIGMMLIYLLFSLLMTALREIIEAFVKTRAVDLERALAEMLGDPNGTGDRTALFTHPLIFSLFPGAYRPTGFAAGTATSAAAPWRPSARETPSYIPGELFADAMLDLEAGGKLGTSAAVMEALLRRAGDDPAIRREKIIAWYDATMERATGWYRRRTQKLLLALGLGLAIGLNINSATLVDHLSTNDALREQLVAAAAAQGAAGAAARPDACTDESSPACVKALNGQIQGLKLPVGWNAEGQAPWRALAGTFGQDWLLGLGRLLVLLAGFAATALAVSLGAPFWFDLLSKVVNVRSTLKPDAR